MDCIPSSRQNNKKTRHGQEISGDQRRLPEIFFVRSATNSTLLSFAFEFLGLNAKEVVTESDVEQALMDHLQEFLLEMGKGFCFEARQKRIVIDDEYYFIDLVLYHRILHS